MDRLMDSVWYLAATSVVMLIFLIRHMTKLKRREEGVKIFHWICSILLAVVLTVIFQVTISPVYGLHFNIRTEEVNLVPLKVLAHASGNLMNFYGNVLLFLPVGALTVLLSRDYGKVYKTVLYGASISISIEILQLFLSRGTDIDDVILNTLGTFIGALLMKLMLWILPGLKRQIGIWKLSTGRIRKKDGSYLPRLTVSVMLAVLACGGGIRYQTFKKTNQNYVIEAVLEKQKVNQTQATEVNNTSKHKGCAFSLEAEHVYFYNAVNDEKIYGKDEDERIAPASTTKMLTALVVMDHCQLDEIVTVGDELSYIHSDASVAGLKRGMQLDVRSMLAALLLPSGNDAAYSLAVHTGKIITGNDGLSEADAIQVFVDTMNKKAKKLGANDSNFLRPDGYDEKNQYTTASDLGKIAKEFMECRTIQEISASDKMRCVGSGGLDLTFRNTDELVCPESPFYMEEVIGGKTGSSGKAGKCLVSGAKINGQLYIAVVMGDSVDGRFDDSMRLYNSVKYEIEDCAQK